MEQGGSSEEWSTLLSGPDVERRRAAAAALCRGGAERAVLPLVRATADDDEQVGESSNEALESLGVPPVEVAPQLAGLLDQPAPSGYWAATLLGRLGGAATAWSGDLGQALTENPDLSVRQRAAWALEKLGAGAAAARSALEQAARSDDRRLARLAQQALEKLAAAS